MHLVGVLQIGPGLRGLWCHSNGRTAGNPQNGTEKRGGNSGFPGHSEKHGDIGSGPAAGLQPGDGGARVARRGPEVFLPPSPRLARQSDRAAHVTGFAECPCPDGGPQRVVLVQCGSREPTNPALTVSDVTIRYQNVCRTCTPRARHARGLPSYDAALLASK